MRKKYVKPANVEKKLRSALKWEKERYDDLSKRHETLLNDRQMFRREILAMFREQVEIAGKGDHYTSAAMVERIAKIIGKAESWYW